jgi:hypothetical protein
MYEAMTNELHTQYPDRSGRGIESVNDECIDDL